MREIKFRVWCKQTEEMKQVSKIGFEEGKLWYVMDEDHENQPPYFEDDDDWVLMQYTGINDMYGQEVFEGDILETKQRHTDKLIITKVEFVEGAFVETIVRDESERINRSFIPLDADCSKMIGNIYENPKLLEELQNGTK